MKTVGNGWQQDFPPVMDDSVSAGMKDLYTHTDSLGSCTLVLFQMEFLCFILAIILRA
jgi:hypothetical protein